MSAIATMCRIEDRAARCRVDGLLTQFPLPFLGYDSPYLVHRYPESPLFSEDDFVLFVNESKPGHSFYIRLHSGNYRPHFFLPMSWPYNIAQFRIRAHLCLMSFSKVFFQNERPPLVLEWTDGRSDRCLLGLSDVFLLDLNTSASSSFPLFPFFRTKVRSALLRDLEKGFHIVPSDLFTPLNISWAEILAIPSRLKLNFGPSQCCDRYVKYRLVFSWDAPDFRITIGKLGSLMTSGFLNNLI